MNYEITGSGIGEKFKGVQTGVFATGDGGAEGGLHRVSPPAKQRSRSDKQFAFCCMAHRIIST